MSNYCSYEMKVVGNKENVDSLVAIMNEEYHLTRIFKDSETVVYLNEDQKPHLYRVYTAVVTLTEERDENTHVAVIVGSCAWSVSACMTDQSMSYYEQYKDKLLDSKATHLQALSGQLELEIEVLSNEPGNCFAEHYIFNHGMLVTNECYDYEEEYDDETDTYHTKSDVPVEFSI